MYYLMEENKAILIADLSGYTALTETHGSITAADMIDKFIKIVKDCLVSETELHQCIGDEVVIVSNSPDHLVNTAVKLMQKCSGEEYFLQVHGGLHYGGILKRNNNYFGSAINLCSRIANKAGKGTFLCSEQFKNALSHDPNLTFESKGMYRFKNVSEDQQVWQLVNEVSHPVDIDPVCRMLIHNKETAFRHPEEESIFFCSDDCLQVYLKSNSV